MLILLLSYLPMPRDLKRTVLSAKDPANPSEATSACWKLVFAVYCILPGDDPLPAYELYLAD